MKIKTILVSQPAPATEKSPYHELENKLGVQIDFRPFIQVEGVSSKDFRAQKINILEHTAVIFTSRTAIDHYFRICNDLKITVPDSMKYFCISEATAFYLQKYIVYRKRKIFYGTGKFENLMEVMQKHKGEKFIVPLSDMHKPEIPMLLDSNGYDYTKAIMYKTVSTDLSDLANVNYDVLVFFSPSGIASLNKNFPMFKQNDTMIAAFGSSTAKAVEEAGLRLDIAAPNPKAPSMTMALSQFITEYNKKQKSSK